MQLLQSESCISYLCSAACRLWGLVSGSFLCQFFALFQCHCVAQILNVLRHYCSALGNGVPASSTHSSPDCVTYLMQFPSGFWFYQSWFRLASMDEVAFQDTELPWWWMPMTVHAISVAWHHSRSLFCASYASTCRLMNMKALLI
jgi:hypothetical protein